MGPPPPASNPYVGTTGTAPPFKPVTVAEFVPYEISETMRERHEEAFYEHSSSLEDSLRNLQVVLLVDISGSMLTEDLDGKGEAKQKGMHGPWSRYDNTFQAAKYMAESIFEYDKDGQIPIVFFGDRAEHVVVDSIGKMMVQFKKRKPAESTNMYDALKLAFDRELKEADNTLFIMFTDGAPNPGQEPHIKTLIHDRLSKRDPKGARLNILFLRLGDDEKAMAFLQDLDDCAEIGENVDTKSDNAMYAMGPKNLMLNAIHEHLDAQYQSM